MHKKARKQFAEDKQTKDMEYWNHVLWSDETKINLFGSDGVKRVWWQPGEYKDKRVLPTGGSVMVWGCMGAASTGELQFIEGNHECQHVLLHTEAEQDPLPLETGPQGSITLSFCRRFYPKRLTIGDDHSRPHKQSLQHDNDHCLAKEAEGKGNQWGILKRKVEKRKVSSIHRLRDVVMKWKRTPVATWEALVNSMPKRVKAVL